MDQSKSVMSRPNARFSEKFYDPKIGLTGANKFFKKLKETDPSIKREEVNQFIKNQELTQVYAKPNIPKKSAFKILGRMGHFQSDLTFYEQYKRQNGGYSIILVMIEVNTKRAYSIALKDKSASTMRKGLEELVEMAKRNGDGVSVIQSDLGKEYQNKEVTDYLESQGIQQVFCPVSTLKENDKRCLAVAERFNRTIKNLLNKWMTVNNSVRWTDALNDILENYNNTYHSSIKMKPSEVTLEKEKELMTDKFMHNQMGKERIRNSDIQVGDKVRLPVKKKLFEKEGKSYSDEIYTVSKVNSKTVLVQGKEDRIPKDSVLKINEAMLERLPSQDAQPFVRQDAQKQAKKEAKVTRLVEQREGLDRSNITQEKRIRKAPERLRF